MKRIVLGIMLAALTIILAAGCTNPASDPLKSSNANLSALTVSAGTLTPVFSAETKAYAVSVPNEKTSITITGTVSDSYAKLSENNGVAQDLKVGITTVTLKVTAQDGTTKDYVVTVTRVGSSNADLSALAVSNGALGPSFVAGTMAYTVNVPYTTTTFTVTGTSSDANAKLSANSGVAQTMAVGANTITIRVTAQDGTTKDYVVTVTRLSLLTLVTVPAGSFQRDDTASNISTISTSFRMSQYEITRAQFAAIMVTDPSETSLSSGSTDPVQMSNWYHAIAFCNKLSIAEGLTRVYNVPGFTDDAAWTALSYVSIPTTSNAIWDAVTATWTNNGYRLPTEMEWMWAAMGATSDRTNGYTGTGTNTKGYTKGYAGSMESAGAQVNIGNFTWYSVNAGSKTLPVGGKLPNELGLYDMSGNVWEWNWDWYADNGTGTNYAVTGTQVDYRGAASSASRALRGGCRNNGASFHPVAYRDSEVPYLPSVVVGFRVVRR